MAFDEDFESRLVDLESRIAFQDETLEELNSVMVNQQQEIDELKLTILKLTSNIKSIQEEKTDPADEPPPPHY